MSGVDIANAVFELTGVAFGGILFYCGVRWFIGLFSRRRKPRAKGRYYSRHKKPRERSYGYSNYRKERSYSGRSWFRRRYPEWERWTKGQTDYLGGMFHEIEIRGYRAVYCMDYYPKNKYPDAALSVEQIRVREFLLGVKDGRFADRSADILAHYLLGHFWKDDLKKWAVCYIPAATQERTNRRYNELANKVLSKVPVMDGRGWIRVVRDRGASRESAKGDDTTWNLSFDREKIQGKRIFLVDDITTRGMSFVQCARKLKENGAADVVGFFFGKSVYSD